MHAIFCIPAMRTTGLNRGIFRTPKIICVDSGIESKVINFKNNLIIWSTLTIFTRFCLQNSIMSSANIVQDMFMIYTVLGHVVVVVVVVVVIVVVIIIIIIIIIKFLTSQLWLGNIHLSWDVVINRIRLGGLTFSLKVFTIEQVPRITDFCSFIVCIGVQVMSC